MVTACGDDMTMPKFRQGSCSDRCFLRAKAYCACRAFVRPKGVCTMCRRSCTGGFHPHCDPFLLALPSPVHTSVCSRRHDFVAQTRGFPGRSGFCRNNFGVIYGCRTSRRQSAGVWDPDVLPGGSGWFIRRTLGPEPTLLIFPSAEHTQEWNFDPDGWDAGVEDWLRNAPPSSAASL